MTPLNPAHCEYRDTFYQGHSGTSVNRASQPEDECHYDYTFKYLRLVTAWYILVLARGYLEKTGTGCEHLANSDEFMALLAHL